MSEKFYVKLDPCGIKYENGKAIAIGKIQSLSGPVEISVIHDENGLCDMMVSSSADILHGNIFLEIVPDRNIYNAGEFCIGKISDEAELRDGAKGYLQFWLKHGERSASLDPVELYSEERALKILEAEKPFAVYYWTLANELENMGLETNDVSLESIRRANEELGGGTLDDAVGEAGAEVVADVLNGFDFENKPEVKPSTTSP